MKLIPIILIISLLTLIGCDSPSSRKAESIIPTKELQQLDLAITNVDRYAVKARHPVDSLKRIADTTTNDAKAAGCLARMAHQMSELNNDTAVRYADEAVKRATMAGIDSLLTIAQIVRFYTLAAGGVFDKAEKEIEKLQTKQMSTPIRVYFWQVAKQMYAYAEMYTESNTELSGYYRDKSLKYVDSLITVLDPADTLMRFFNAERQMNHGNLKLGKATLDSLITPISPGHQMYSMIAFQLAQYYKQTNDQKNYGLYLAKAAESDIRTGVREGLALFNLANWLYAHGEINDAYRYINFAMKEAMKGNARMRAGNIATMLPMIDDHYQESMRHEHKVYFTLIVITSLALIIALIFLALMLKQYRRGQKERLRMEALSHTREIHLANFLTLCSTYYHKLENLQTMVTRKIASGQSEELIKLLKSGKYNDSEADEIFSSFDRSFIEIYPDFTAQINSLLKPEMRYPDTQPDTLQAELRIYALVTMGITESQRIAKILNYSVNTVYAYRNKMRNKAINRDTFEDDVAAIKSFIRK